MRRMTVHEVEQVRGGTAKQERAQACANDIMTAGGMAGTLGATIGGAIGSVVPGFGTIAGATLGGLAGIADTEPTLPNTTRQGCFD